MLKDVSRINNREQQEGWSGKSKRRRKKNSEEEKRIVTNQGGDTLDLSHPARWLALFDKVDFKHRSNDGLLSFELKTHRDYYDLTISGNVHTQTFQWDLSLLIQSERKGTDENELPDILNKAFTAGKSNTDKAGSGIHLTAEKSRVFLSDESGGAAVILRDFLNLIQNMLPLDPPLKTGLYSSGRQMEDTLGNTEAWPVFFNRNKVSGLNFRWIVKVP